MNNLDPKLKLINSLTLYCLEFGVFDEDSEKIINVNILNTDNTITKSKMSVGDVMYFTEYGTLSTPGRFVLRDILLWVKDNIGIVIDEIVYNVLNNDWTEQLILDRLNNFAKVVELQSKSILNRYISDNKTAKKILKNNVEEYYLYDLDKLSRFIKCKIVKNIN